MAEHRILLPLLDGLLDLVDLGAVLDVGDELDDFLIIGHHRDIIIKMARNHSY